MFLLNVKNWLRFKNCDIIYFIELLLRYSKFILKGFIMGSPTQEYASKGVAGTGLGLGIAGTALGLLNGSNCGLL